MTTILPADLVIKNVSVITMNPDQPFAKGVAIAKGRVLGLLNDKNDKWPLAPNGKCLDGHELTLLPGLIDAHCHLRAQISNNLSIPCGKKEVASIDDIVQAVCNQARYLRKDMWIRASGYDPFYLREKRHPTRWDLDKATTVHPVRLRHVTRHASVLNSVALTLAGIGRETVDPKGVLVEREPESKTPTGIIYGGDAWLSQHYIPSFSWEELQSGADQLQRFLLSKGITAVQDATPTNTDADLAFWASQIKKKWPITIQLMSSDKNHKLMNDMLKNQYSGYVTNYLQMGPVKIVMEANPDIYPPLHELNRIVSEASKRNFPVAVHVVNPEMIWSAIQAIEGTKYPAERTLRHRLEHLSLCPEIFIPNIFNNNIMVVTNPNLVYNHGDRYLADVETNEQQWLYRMNSIKNAGIPLAAGSDAPVASFDPWLGIKTASTRMTLSGQVINTAEKLSRWHSLEMFTTDAALAGGWENNRGMIKSGFHADVIAVDRDPLTCSVGELSNIRVHATWIKGKLVYDI